VADKRVAPAELSRLPEDSASDSEIAYPEGPVSVVAFHSTAPVGFAAVVSGRGFGQGWLTEQDKTRHSSGKGLKQE
jgi:hypothetical protein